MSTTEPTSPAPAERCAACGAPKGTTPPAEDAAALETAVEADTHCEWCGAEYEPPRRD